MVVFEPESEFDLITFGVFANSSSCPLSPCSVEQLQYMYSSLQQQLALGSMVIRRNRGSAGSMEGGRIFKDALAWISQQKVRHLKTGTRHGDRNKEKNGKVE